MTIVFSCSCGREFQVPEELAGKKAECKTCGVLLTVPAPAVEPDDLPALDLSSLPPIGTETEIPGEGSRVVLRPLRRAKQLPWDRIILAASLAIGSIVACCALWVGAKWALDNGLPEGTLAQPSSKQPSWSAGRGGEQTNSIGMKLRLIPAGEFMMGSPGDEEDRHSKEKQHRVRITKPFHLGVHEVTQEQYKQVMEETPSPFGGWNRPVESTGPVENVSWPDAAEFCWRLSAHEGREYRLPTEAEWEYACRAGTTTPFSFGGVLNGKQANCNGNKPYGTQTKGPYLKQTTTVGSYDPNAFGLCDMHGNVWEWCEDWYGGDYYEKSPTEDPTGPTEGKSRVVRGGNWNSDGKHCRSAARGRIRGRRSSCGFRVAVGLSDDAEEAHDPWWMAEQTAIDLQSWWALGEKHVLELLRERKYYRNGTLVSEHKARILIDVEVLRRTDEGYVLRWTHRVTKEPTGIAGNYFIKDRMLATLSKEIRRDIRTYMDGTPEGLDNLKEAVAHYIRKEKERRALALKRRATPVVPALDLIYERYHAGSMGYYTRPMMNPETIKESMADLGEGIRRDIRTDMDGTPVGLDNLEEVIAHYRKENKELTLLLEADAVPAVAVQEFMRDIESMMNPETIEVMAIEHPRVFLFVCGGSFAFKERREYEHLLPNQFGGEPFPCKGHFLLREIRAEDETAIIEWKQTLDPEKGTDLPGFAIEDDGRFVIDTSTGWPRSVFHRRCVSNGDRRRIDTYTYRTVSDTGEATR